MACGVDEPEMAGPGTKLSSVDVEPIGANCPAGGVAIHSGVDTDDNGMLDASEITSTTYTCNHKSLLREDTVLSGPVCPGGGVAVRTGRDLNDNGSLEDPEIESTTTVCYSDELFHGDLRTSAFTTDVAKQKLSHVRVVNGSVIIDSAVSLPNLTTIGANLDVRTSTSVELPALDRINGNLTASRTVRFKAPALTNVGGSVSMTAVDAEGMFSAPSLKEVEGELVLSGAISILDLQGLKRVGKRLDLDVQPATLALPALQQAERVIISGWFTNLDLHALETTNSFDLVYSKLTSLSLPALKTASIVRIGNSAPLKTIEMREVAGVKSLTLYSLPKLTTFDLPQVTGLDTFTLASMSMPNLQELANLRTINTLKIQGNPKLVDLRGLEALTTVTTVQISDNPMLASFAGLEDLTKISGNIVITKNASLTSFAGLDALTNVSGTITVSDNDALPQAEIDAFMKRLGR
jgi:hypothetical protein